MLMFKVTNLDYIATMLKGMAIRFHDDGEYNTANELNNMAKELKDISKGLIEELFSEQNTEPTDSEEKKEENHE